jgi:prepilin-type N-terminal cleavage/methylation domain-containing protein
LKWHLCAHFKIHSLNIKSTLNSRLQLSLLKQKKGNNLAEKGFTLIELLITVVILGTLSAVAVPGFLAQQDKANHAAANAHGRALMASCGTAISTNNETEVDLNLREEKKFGNITWTPTLKPADFSAAPTECSSETTGAKVLEQEYYLDIATGGITDKTKKLASVDASNKEEQVVD